MLISLILEYMFIMRVQEWLSWPGLGVGGWCVMDYSRFLSSESDLMRDPEIRELLKLTERGDIVSFAGGLPDPQAFPSEELAEVVSFVLREFGASALQYGPTRGATPYVKELTEFLYRVRGLKTSIEEVVVTVGSQQALDVLARILVNPGDYVVVEEPTYLAALNVLKLRRPRFVGVPVDEEGLLVDVLEDKLRGIRGGGGRVKFLYTIPVAQNPAGVTLSSRRKKRLVELAEEYDFLIIEDDVYGLLVFEEGVDATPVRVLAPERTVYVGSFSKILSPGMRLGHVVAPQPLADVLERAKQYTDLHTPTLTQYVAMEALRRGVVERNLPRVKTLYKLKRDIMLDALQENMPGRVWWTKPAGGMFIWLKLNARVDTSHLLPKAVERGVAYVPGKAFYHDARETDTMRLNYTKPTAEQIRKGVETLAKVVKEVLK